MPTTTIKIERTIDDLSLFALEQGINYKILKFYNPWINFNPVIDHPDDLNLEKSKRRKIYKKAYAFVVPPGKSYDFELPLK